MPHFELLNPQTHSRLRLRAASTPAPHFVPVVAAEFAAAAACCPILFTKEAATGQFYAGALFGFKAGENLLGSIEERGGFDPLTMQREGFFITGEQISLDREHARFSDSEGDALFDDAHAPTPVLRAIQRTMGELHAGLAQTRTFIAALSELKLIEPIDISLNFTNDECVHLQGLYTVSLDRLRDVDDATALRLFRAGHLQSSYLMAASLKHIGRLAHLRSDRR